MQQTNENYENGKSNKSAQKYSQTTSVYLLRRCTWTWKEICIVAIAWIYAFSLNL